MGLPYLGLPYMGHPYMASVRRHGLVILVNVKVTFHLEFKLRLFSAQFMLRWCIEPLYQ